MTAAEFKRCLVDLVNWIETGEKSPGEDRLGHLKATRGRVLTGPISPDDRGEAP
jgi:hypothetical protein